MVSFPKGEIPCRLPRYLFIGRYTGGRGTRAPFRHRETTLSGTRSLDFISHPGARILDYSDFQL